MSVLNTISSKEAIDLEYNFGAHNYHPLPVVLNKGDGVFVWDVEGKNTTISCLHTHLLIKVIAIQKLLMP